jgi:hypothetical protein
MQPQASQKAGIDLTNHSRRSGRDRTAEDVDGGATSISGGARCEPMVAAR